MRNTILDVVVVGGGQSGLSASYHLQQRGLQHIVFERGQIGASWHAQRWDSFKLNTPNKLNVLPGVKYEGNDPDGFCTAAEFAASLAAYQQQFQLPVVENAHVVSIEKENDLFKTTVDQHGVFYSKQVIIASGEQSECNPPALPTSLHQLHAGEYRNAAQLPPGAVLVVGSAQSGAQITEDLLAAGRKVFLATSKVPRAPGHYRGRDIMDWLVITKFFDARKEDITDPQHFQLKAPLLTGIGKCRRTISLQMLAKKGAVLLGRLTQIQNGTLCFLPNAASHIQFADAFSQRIKSAIDAFIQNNNLVAPEAEPDKNDEPDTAAASASNVTSLPAGDIGSIIWATGFKADYSYLKMPVLDPNGQPVHQHGVSNIEGLYFLGLHWLRTRKSGLILGVQEDAAFIVSSLTVQ